MQAAHSSFPGHLLLSSSWFNCSVAGVSTLQAGAPEALLKELSGVLGASQDDLKQEMASYLQAFADKMADALDRGPHRQQLLVFYVHQ